MHKVSSYMELEEDNERMAKKHAAVVTPKEKYDYHDKGYQKDYQSKRASNYHIGETTKDPPQKH